MSNAEIVEQLHLRNLENVTSNSSNALFSYCRNFYCFVLLTMDYKGFLVNPSTRTTALVKP